MSRRIAHLDMDAFYVSVELRRRPELRGLPVVVSGTGPRAVVTTASYEARRFGVGSAMPASRARRLCPDAVWIPPDFTAYREASQQVMGIVREEVERVEVVGLDEAYLDLTGLSSPRAAMRRVIARIRAEAGLDSSVGIGPNKLVAKIASDCEKPRGFVVLSIDDARRRFAGHSPGLVPGIGPRTQERLAALGITTLGQLAAADEDRIAGAFGPRHGRDLVRRARFEHDGAVEPVRIAVSESRETTFPVDVADREEQAAALRTLAYKLGESLVKKGKAGRTVAIKVRLDDFTTFTRARTLPDAVGEPERIARVADELLREAAPERPLRLLGVRVAAFVSEDGTEELPETAQLSLPLAGAA